LAPLASVPGVHFFSLQIDARAEEASAPPNGMTLTDLSAELTDFVETAGALRNLDLVITTDTSMPHLAGALGVPVWVALHDTPHWVWMLERPGDWQSVFTAIAAALSSPTFPPKN
jgi:ADP-heptose:LPS heptosyltransferase